jgi:DNA-binding MarR family transcriptional regulator
MCYTVHMTLEQRLSWTFLSNHAHVLICLSQDNEMRLRDVADKVGITERAVQRIIVELEVACAISRSRDGRRNRYTIHPDLALRHPLEAHRTIADIIAIGTGEATASAA